MHKSTVLLVILLNSSVPASAKVQGLYGSDCLSVEGLSAYKDLAFNGAELKQVQTVYLDNECQNNAYDFTFTGPYTFDDVTGYLDYSFDFVRLTALDQSVAENFNNYQLCGISTWSVGVAQNVAGLYCGGQLIPNLHTNVFDLLQDNLDSIRMSHATHELDGSTSEKRPHEFDEIIFKAK